MFLLEGVLRDLRHAVRALRRGPVFLGTAVLAFAVSARLREFGIRAALGASTPDIRRMVVRDGLRPTVIGLGLGGAAAVLVGQLVRGLLFGLSPLDPVTLGVIAVLLVGAALAACVVPARRATRADPMTMLRSE